MFAVMGPCNPTFVNRAIFPSNNGCEFCQVPNDLVFTNYTLETTIIMFHTIFCNDTLDNMSSVDT